MTPRDVIKLVVAAALGSACGLSVIFDNVDTDPLTLLLPVGWAVTLIVTVAAVYIMNLLSDWRARRREQK